MIMKKNIIVVGGGGHGKVIIDAIRQEGLFTIKGIVDPALEKGSQILGVKVLGGDEILEKLYSSGIRYAFIGTGTIGHYAIKHRIDEKLRKFKFTLPVVCHPSSVIADDAVIGEGSFLAAGTVINPGVVIGKNVIVNTRASIDHDCCIGDYTHISPGATLCGNVTVGREVHIGAGSTVVQNMKIKDKVFVKAGSLVIKNI